MKAMRILLAPAALLFAAACSAAPATTESPAPMTGTATTTVTATSTSTSMPAAGAVNPVGAFSFTTSIGGDNVAGTVEIEGAPGAYRGRIVTSVLPPLAISSVTVNGQQLMLTADTPDGEVAMTLNFSGTDFTGNWTLGGGGGQVTGRRTR